MDTVSIKRLITIRVKVTENFKKLLAAELQESIRRTETELQHLEFQSKRMLVEVEKQNPANLASAKQHYEKEKQKRQATRQQMLDKLKDVGKLAIGAEVVQGTVESNVDVKIGDYWQDIFGVEIVLKDGLVVEIRRKGMPIPGDVDGKR